MENNSILCCINGHKLSDAVIDYGVWLSLKGTGKLKLFHAVDIKHQDNADLSGSIGLGANEDLLESFVEAEHQQNKALLQSGKVITQEGQTRAAKNGAKDIEVSLLKGTLIDNVMDLKDSMSIAIIGKQSTDIGNKVESIVRALEKPLLMVSDDFKEPTSICLAYDGSEGSKKALNFIGQNSRFHNLEVHLVHVGDESEEIKKVLSEAKANLDTNSIKSKISFLQGDVSDALKDYVLANGISILAMGAFGHHWLRDMVIGSFTSKVMKTMDVPLLLVR